jgi:NAD(P)-dependent dehydrogenase (short-subunit alcohol dehydrogenase family)
MRIVEILLAFPYLLLAIAVVSALGPGVLNTTIAVGIWGAPTATRLARSACWSRAIPSTRGRPDDAGYVTGQTISVDGGQWMLG